LLEKQVSLARHSEKDGMSALAKLIAGTIKARCDGEYPVSCNKHHEHTLYLLSAFLAFLSFFAFVSVQSLRKRTGRERMEINHANTWFRTS